MRASVASHWTPQTCEQNSNTTTFSWLITGLQGETKVEYLWITVDVSMNVNSVESTERTNSNTFAKLWEYFSNSN